MGTLQYAPKDFQEYADCGTLPANVLDRHRKGIAAINLVLKALSEQVTEVTVNIQLSMDVQDFFVTKELPGPCQSTGILEDTIIQLFI